jgi:uncharacterized protein DUF3990
VPRWLNQDLYVYHGTDSHSVGASSVATGGTLPFAVKLALCRPNTDFGQGFYVTTHLHQAEQWANQRVTSLPSTSLFAVVFRFQVDRDWLASLDALSFVRPTNDFWDLVVDCRLGFPPHQRTFPPSYDVVYGPVSLWPQILTIQDCDQISFHTAKAVTGLPNPVIHKKANDSDPKRLLF